MDQIKIDRSFIMNLPDASSTALLQGILALAHMLDVEVVAEGVETVEQLEVLRASGCGLAQGYLLGRPAPAFASSPLRVAEPVRGASAHSN